MSYLLDTAFLQRAQGCIYDSFVNNCLLRSYCLGLARSLYVAPQCALPSVLQSVLASVAVCYKVYQQSVPVCYKVFWPVWPRVLQSLPPECGSVAQSVQAECGYSLEKENK